MYYQTLYIGLELPETTKPPEEGWGVGGGCGGECDATAAPPDLQQQTSAIAAQPFLGKRFRHSILASF